MNNDGEGNIICGLLMADNVGIVEMLIEMSGQWDGNLGDIAAMPSFVKHKGYLMMVVASKFGG